MSLRPFLLALAPLVLGSGCFWTNEHPCPDGVREGDVNYRDGFFYTTDGLIYGQAGSSPIRECHTITGNIVLSGVIEHFEDFENIESVRGFFDAGVDLPAAGDHIEGLRDTQAICGLIQGFPNLKEILRDQMYTSAFVDHQEGCFYYDGFGQLEYVGGDYACAGSERVGQSLVEVEGTLHCDNSRLENLEAVGELLLDGTPLPALRWAGALRMPITLRRDDPRVELPLLAEVGNQEGSWSGELLLGGGGSPTLELTSLQRVWGDLEISGFVDLELSVADAERGDEIRRRLQDVDVYGRRAICRNGPADPCPWDEECELVHGAGSVLCCNDDWPTCLETRGDDDGQPGS